ISLLPDVSSALPSLVKEIQDRVPDARRRRAALLNLARHLPSSQAHPILKDVLTRIRMLLAERDLLQAFAQVAPYLPLDLLNEACQGALELAPDRTFAMPDAMRPQVIEYLAKHVNFGLERLRRVLSTLGRRLVDAAGTNRVDVAAATIRWARVAALCE